jgi:hypothetical protein
MAEIQKSKINTLTPFNSREFHISRRARDRYGVDASLFNLSGNIVFPNFSSVQNLAKKMTNIKARAGHINAMGLMDEIQHYLISLYNEQVEPKFMQKTLKHLNDKLGKKTVDKSLKLFAQEFPPLPVYKGECHINEYLPKTTSGIPHRQILLEEMIMLWLSNNNPAYESYKKELFDDNILIRESSYLEVMKHVGNFLSSLKPFGPDNQSLITMLETPSAVSPHSIAGQLKYIHRRWGILLEVFNDRIILGIDTIREEEKFAPGGPGIIPVYDFFNSNWMEQDEKFSLDPSWMASLVLIAKHTLVWLSQLSRKYQRQISSLDQIPDQELDELAKRGFTGLWLIGIWERSRASEKIKKICGNPQALASSYSIYDYHISDILGGEDAFNNLKYRLWARGIRIASDMVPNHMGIDSPWLVDHPDWFLSVDQSPFPVYSFNGPDLSSDSRVSIFIEDHYYDRTDAAVVFKYVDHRDNRTRYIYHGNDGTSTPWNDTAQLNYLNPEVREAILQTISTVAQRFPIIRFDAAMTLTQKHYQRLWFPEPGHGGAIPSRSRYGMNKQEFFQHMPEEFWRQVVNKFSETDSDTLLLAEAFWMMEPYFVRNLGMHRVYNSAFMNFLKNEENNKFRLSVINILKFNPEILKRFVNFMNNPDEESAVVQFGREDKYFGVCTLMVTLPGLPMFGHGQIEGLAEKYGMEYRQAYWDEHLDSNLIKRHENEIFPLLKKRYLFAHIDNFLFYDFYTTKRQINENIIAYSNAFDNQYSLIVYHNRFASTSGWIKVSVPFKQLKNQGQLSSKSLAQGLGLKAEAHYYTIFRDHVSGLEYIRKSQEIVNKGLYISLDAYKRNVFLDFREVKDKKNGMYSQLEKILKGKGVTSIKNSLKIHFLNPVVGPFKNLISQSLFHQFVMNIEGIYDSNQRELVLQDLEKNLPLFIDPLNELLKIEEKPQYLNQQLKAKRDRLFELILLSTHNQKNQTGEYPQALQYLLKPIRRDKYKQLFSYLYLLLPYPKESIEQDLWFLSDEISDFFTREGLPSSACHRFFQLMKTLGVLQIHINCLDGKKIIQGAIEVFSNRDFLSFIGINRYDGIDWFYQEAIHELFYWFFLTTILHIPLKADSNLLSIQDQILDFFRIIKFLEKAMDRSFYQVERAKRILKLVNVLYFQNPRKKVS